MGKRYFEHWMESIDDEDFILIGSRIDRAAERRQKRRDADEFGDRDWSHRRRQRIRPESHRDRYTW